MFSSSCAFIVSLLLSHTTSQAFMFLPWITFYSTTGLAHWCWQPEFKLQLRELSEQSERDRLVKRFHRPAKSRNTKGGTGLSGDWGASASFPRWRKEGGAHALAWSEHVGWACQFPGGGLWWDSLAETGRHKFLTLRKGGGSSVCRATTEPSPWPRKGESG